MLAFNSTVKCPFKRFTCTDTALTCADDVSLPPVCSIPLLYKTVLRSLQYHTAL